MSADDTVRALAVLITQEAIRQDRGWDYQGVWAAVRRAIDEDDRTPRQIVLAGFSAVDDPSAQTPGAIRWPSRYVAAHATLSANPRAPKCATCSRTAAAHDLAEAKLPADQRHSFNPHRPHASGQEASR
jgi:hypothetical protein